ncbi:MAG: hypothetical protein ABRQ29_05345, partial [Smithellaceae bacterium]
MGMYKMTSTLKQIPYHQLDWLRARHGVIVPFFIFSLGVAFTTRIALLIKAARFISWDLSLPAAFGWGILYDIGAACWFALPCIVILTILPERFFERTWGRYAANIFAFSAIFILLFAAIGEW